MVCGWEQSWKKLYSQQKVGRFLKIFGVFLIVIVVFSSLYTSANSIGNGEQTTELLIGWGNLLQVVANVAYVILRPLVALAGLAMDNQLIYGSFMGLDASLWQIWQIVRTFSNYALGLIFLIWVLNYNLSPSKKVRSLWFFNKIGSPTELITKTLIASVLIQATWFIMMVLVDLSTILTYSVGGIPTSIITQLDEKVHDVRMLSTNVLLNLGDEGLQKDKTVDQAIVTYWTTKQNNKDTNYIAPCKIAEVQKQKFIVGRAFDSLTGSNWSGWFKKLTMIPGYCSHIWALYSFVEFERTGGEKQANYQQKLKSFVRDLERSSEDQVKKLIAWGMIYPISPWAFLVNSGGKAPSATQVDGYQEGDTKYGYKGNGLADCDVFWFVPAKAEWEWDKAKYKCLYDKTDISLSTIINKWKSMTWPFVSLYSNMFNFADLSGYKDLWVWQLFILALINTGFSVLLILPLIALVVVLFARVGILWIAIALSPFIALLKIFGGKALPEWLSIDWLMKLLIAPVLISFAVSISLVFMSALKSSLGNEASGPSNGGVSTAKVLKDISGFEVDPKDESLWILGFIKIHLNNGLLNLSWVVIMLFGLGITWFLLFWAIKQTSVGKAIWSSLQELWQKTFMSTPFIPIGSKWLSLQTLKNASVGGDSIANKFANKLQEESDKNLKDWLSPDDNDKGNDDKAFKEKSKAFFTEGADPISTFNIDHNNVNSALDTYKNLDEIRSSTYTSQENATKMANLADTLWKGQLDKWNSAKDDPEVAWSEASKIKWAMEAILSDGTIQKSGRIGDWSKNANIKIGNKHYSLDATSGKLTVKGN